MDFSGKTAFVSGAASGIGLATAVAFAQRGAAVALADVSADRLEEAGRAVRAAGAPRVTVHPVDVSKADQVERAAAEVLESHGGVEIVFANAGVGLLGVPLTRTRSSEAHWLMDVNVMGVFETARTLLPAMIASGKPGIFVCTASLAALHADRGAHSGLYSASKFGVAALAAGIREDCGDAPILVSVVYPGPIETNIAANAEALRPAGGVAGSVPPMLAELVGKMGISSATAADIILEGLDVGLEHIFTHPDMSEHAHRAYSHMVMEGIEGSRRLKSTYRAAEPAV